jgi:hypothetical protein
MLQVPYIVQEREERETEGLSAPLRFLPPFASSKAYPAHTDLEPTDREDCRKGGSERPRSKSS